MNTRLLFVVSIVVAMFAAWFYRSQGELDSAITFSETNIEYQATDILAVQTNERGMVVYSLTADELTHYSDENLDKLQSITVNWRPSSEQKVVINADEAVMYHNDAKVVMTNNVVFASQYSSGTTGSTAAVRPPMQLEATELIGNLDQNKIYSDSPIKVTQADNAFEAARFTADMQNGEYDFAKIATTFMPPARQNTPLF